MRTLPRGVRNNNPGNIDFNPANKWQGQVGIEKDVPNPRFAKFDTAQNGIRAIAKLLLNYHKKGFRTVQQIINRWAPPSENDTGAYVSAVAFKLGVQPTEVIGKFSTFQLTEMVRAIIKHENGYEPYDRHTVEAGVLEALK